MAPTGIQAVDSLSAHEFKVEINGQEVSGIFAVQGLTSFSSTGAFPPLTITKMVQQGAEQPFNAWIRETEAGEEAVRDVAIVAMDEGKETRRWVYRAAQIIHVGYSDFDTGRSELVEERVTLKADAVDVIWP
jgi:hypothetical protein